MLYVISTLVVVLHTRIQFQDPEIDKHWLITVSRLFSRVAPQAASSPARKLLQLMSAMLPPIGAETAARPKCAPVNSDQYFRSREGCYPQSNESLSHVFNKV